MAKPGKWDDPDLINTLAAHIRQSIPMDVACRAAGVHHGNVRRWRAHVETWRTAGEPSLDDDPKRPTITKVQAVDRLEQAWALAEIDLINELRPGNPGWQAQAWLLERSRAARWSLVPALRDVDEPEEPPLARAPMPSEESLRRAMAETLRDIAS